MKQSIRLTPIGLCLLSFACGGVDNAAAPGDNAGGAEWLPTVELGEGGASSTDSPDEAFDGEASVVHSTTQDLTLPGGWTLQLPNNKTASATSDSKPWFYSNGSSRVFADPQSGITTSGSSHCRTEMRENQTFKASGTNTLTVTGKVTKGSSGITIGQVFNDNDRIPLAELEFLGNRFGVLYEEAKGGSGGIHYLSGSVQVGQTYTYTMSLTKGLLTVKTSTGGSYSTRPSSKVSGNNFYFKVGNYDQHTTKSASNQVSSTIRSTVEVSSLSASHR